MADSKTKEEAGKAYMASLKPLSEFIDSGNEAVDVITEVDLLNRMKEKLVSLFSRYEESVQALNFLGCDYDLSEVSNFNDAHFSLLHRISRRLSHLERAESVITTGSNKSHSSHYEIVKEQALNHVKGQLADSLFEVEQAMLESEYKIKQIKSRESYMAKKALEELSTLDISSMRRPVQTAITTSSSLPPVSTSQGKPTVISSSHTTSSTCEAPSHSQKVTVTRNPVSHDHKLHVSSAEFVPRRSHAHLDTSPKVVFSTRPSGTAHYTQDPAYSSLRNRTTYYGSQLGSSSQNIPNGTEYTPSHLDYNHISPGYNDHHRVYYPDNQSQSRHVQDSQGRSNFPQPRFHDNSYSGHPNPALSYPPPFMPPIASRRPLPSPTVFSGDPLQYPSWKCSFDALVLSSCMSACERIYYLRQFVSGKALEAIEGFLFVNDQYSFDEAMKLLDYRFGNKFLVGNAFRSKLACWPKVSNYDRSGIRSFSDFLLQCLAAKDRFSLHMLDDEFENVKILEKLPNWVASRWSRIVFECRSREGRFPPFSEFVYFLAKESDMVNDPIFSNFKESRRDHTIVHSTDASQKSPCSFCSGNHFVNYCKSFIELSSDEKRKIIVEKRLCYSCLRSNHISSACQHKLSCNVCKKLHPSSLHYSKGDRATTASINSNMTDDDNHDADSHIPVEVDTSEKALTLFSSQFADDRVTMILPVYVRHVNSPDKESLVYCMLDTQSDSSFIRSDILTDLNISGDPVKLSLSTMDRSNHFVDSLKVKGLQVRGYHSSVAIDIPYAYTRSTIPGNKAHIPTPSKIKGWSHLNSIHNDLIEELNIPIALLIGYNCPEALVPRKIIPAVGLGPFAEYTSLGCGVVGLLDSSQDGAVSNKVLTYEVSDSEGQLSHVSSVCLRSSAKEIFSPQDLCSILERDFKDMELDAEAYSIQDQRFLSLLDKGTKVRSDSHLEMPLPFKACDRPELPSNCKAAFVRLMKLKERFLRDPSFFKDYYEFMNDLFKKGHARRLSDAELLDPGHCWYLPHQGVYNANKPGKIRIVFDASVRYQGVCLNEELLQGPILTNSLLGVLCRFRKESIAVSCDVKSMFHQFYVTEGYTNYFRFYWFPNNDLRCTPVICSMQVHLFGATSSPSWANYGLRKIATLYESEFGSKASSFILRNFYVDDGLISVSSEEEAIDLICKTKQLCLKGGLELHKFVSNSSVVMSSLHSESEQVPIDLPGSDSIERALGVTWCVQSDTFQFRIVVPQKPFTRRGILSVVSSVFDPMGLIGPYILEGKLILQELCSTGATWDDDIPINLEVRWRKFISLLPNLSGLRIERCIHSGRSAVKKVEFHHFSDASLKGYGQCSYARFVYVDDSVSCALVVGKSRVCPLKAVSVPRLELTASVLSVKSSAFLNSQLDYEDVKEYFWTDSKPTLAYIKNETRRFHIFVGNRVQSILNGSSSNQWCYVPSSLNPADKPSRGISLVDVHSDDSWFKGPDFLYSLVIPSFEVGVLNLENDPEVKSQVLSSNAAVTFPSILDRLARFSSWLAAKKALCICLRYRNILLNKVRSERVKVHESHVTVEELLQVELFVIKLVQGSFFHKELVSLSGENIVCASSSISGLNPFLDKNGLIRVGGRLKYSSLSFEAKHPIILPSAKLCHVSHIIIVHYHNRVFHQGRSYTVNELRNSGFWIIHCISNVSSIINSCVKCRKLYRGTSIQKMADLPTDRVSPEAPFTSSGVDFFGPFYVKEGRKIMKRYGVLFTCLSCRAVHVEVTNSLSTDAL